MASKYKVSAGRFYPLGATLYEDGVNFAIFSKYATSVELLLFDSLEDKMPSQTFVINNRTMNVWHIFVEGAGRGQLYAFRVYGDYNPEEGYRFNPNKVLMDPYARAITGDYDIKGDHYGYDINSLKRDLSFSNVDNIDSSPRCIVIDDNFDWKDEKIPQIPLNELVIYETHIKGLTASSNSGVNYPGTYLGVIEKIDYFKKLGVNCLQLLPVHHIHQERHLLEKGLLNYWGYNTLGYFAPDVRFSTRLYPGCQVDEFKTMVRELHRAGIEVILDVVYNHTCEGNEMGPTLCFRGIDNLSYYKLKKDKRYYEDYSGCGNCLNFDEPQVIKLVMDSLRYWVLTMHVDGFRFDLASVLGKSNGKFSQISSFFVAVHQDPLLSRVKLIAEPWDIAAEDSYHLGNFPLNWAELNGRYRDTVRRFVKSNSGMIGEMGYRLTGSSDLYGVSGKTPYHSINFITSHDGFTLNDLVSYSKKHNEANQENNKDGSDDNNSYNWGVEGETDDVEINRLRERLMKNFVAILMLSQGVPMLLGGDEFKRTQKGNNNAYCQDNEISYYDWRLLDKNYTFFEFVRRCIRLRIKNAHFRRPYFFDTIRKVDSYHFNIKWYNERLKRPHWEGFDEYSLAFLIEGCEVDENSNLRNKDFFVILNSHWEPKIFSIPKRRNSLWYRIIDTSLKFPEDIANDEREFQVDVSSGYYVNPRTVVCLMRYDIR